VRVICVNNTAPCDRDGDSCTQDQCDGHGHCAFVQLVCNFPTTPLADPTSIDSYRAHGGYAALRKAIEIGPDEILREVSDSKLLGRGGAAFPMGRKWEAVARVHGELVELVGTPAFEVTLADAPSAIPAVTFRIIGIAEFEYELVDTARGLLILASDLREACLQRYGLAGSVVARAQGRALERIAS
jgi:hypothetical protein